MPNELLPSRAWKKFLPFIQSVGEGDVINKEDLGEDYDFLVSLGVLDSKTNKLTGVGMHLFESLFIHRDNEAVIDTLQQLLLKYPPAVAIQQYLWGVRSDVDQVLVVMKVTGYWSYTSPEPLTHFLELLNHVGIISYHRKTRTVKVLVSPDTKRAPRSIFIDPKRPFSNILWIKRVLSECEGYIYWFDKHFQKEGLDWLWAIADASKVKEIKILSLDLGDANLSGDVKKSCKRLKQELANKGIDFQWSTIDSTLMRDTHDRWIIGDKGYLRNVPNVNAISSGQRSEMNASENHADALAAFISYMKSAKEVRG